MIKLKHSPPLETLLTSGFKGAHQPRPSLRKSLTGFTIFELMIATLIFSVILVVLAAGVVAFSRAYYKGINSSRTQQVADEIINDVAHNIQFGRRISLGFTGPGGTQGFCIDNTLYVYHVGYQVSSQQDLAKHQARHGLVKTIGNDCSAASIGNITSYSNLNASQHELLGEHMRLGQLAITAVGKDLYKINVMVIYGDDDLLAPAVNAGTTNWTNEGCAGTIGSQFCATASLETTVQQRIVKL